MSNGPPDENSRGIVLVVDEVIERYWCRSQVRARVVFLGEDRSPGMFRSLQFLTPAIGRVHLSQLAIPVRDGEPVYLMLRGRNWRPDDAIMQDWILYRYEP